MEYRFKSMMGDPAETVTVTPEYIAGQRVGDRLAFSAPQDLTVEFGSGSVLIQDIDLIVYIVPNEFFCYQGEEYRLRFTLECRRLAVDCRPARGGVNGQVFLAAAD